MGLFPVDTGMLPVRNEHKVQFRPSPTTGGRIDQVQTGHAGGSVLPGCAQCSCMALKSQDGERLAKGLRWLFVRFRGDLERTGMVTQ